MQRSQLRLYVNMYVRIELEQSLHDRDSWKNIISTSAASCKRSYCTSVSVG